MNSKVFVFLVFCVFSTSALLRDVENEEWIQWKNKHEKTYAIHEESHRRSVWEDNRRFVLKHNYEYDLGKHTYKVGLNKFADLTNEEYRAIYLIKMTKSNKDPAPFCQIDNSSKILYGLPTLVDWRKQGYVTPVKNQGQCGSCWAFSTTGALEGQWFKKTGKLVSLSEQNLVDCTFPEGNLGCDGGLPDPSYYYINTNGGIDTEASYPYKAENSKCVYNASNVGATVTGCKAIPTRNEKHLSTALATVGPISVLIDASHISFQLYEEGIYYEPSCMEDVDHLDHAVLAVGYGTSKDGQDYWLVKNSWGVNWGGLGGYITMARNRDNNCGIATSACYPLV